MQHLLSRVVSSCSLFIVGLLETGLQLLNSSLSKVELLEMVLHTRFSSCSEIVLAGSFYLL